MTPSGRRFRTTWPVLPLLMVVGLMAPACGGDDDDASQGDDTAATAVVTEESEVWTNGVAELRVGDCFNPLPVAEDAPLEVEIVACDGPHHAEVTSIDACVAEPEENAKALASYTGTSAAPQDVADWLSSNGVQYAGHWSMTGGCFSYLEGESGDLTRSYRAPDAEN